ncbi:MAG: hypothetical protein R3C16_10650 [Hyphomonadaceae bacterium]
MRTDRADRTALTSGTKKTTCGLPGCRTRPLKPACGKIEPVGGLPARAIGTSLTAQQQRTHIDGEIAAPLGVEHAGGRLDPGARPLPPSSISNQATQRVALPQADTAPPSWFQMRMNASPRMERSTAMT